MVVISCHHEVTSPTGRRLSVRGVRGSTLRGRTVHLHRQCSAFPLHNLRLRSVERRRMRCGCCDCYDQPLSSCCRSRTHLREAAVLMRTGPVLQRTLQVCFCPSELCSLPYCQDTTHFTSCPPPVLSLSSEPRMMGNASHQSGPRFLSTRPTPPTTAAVTKPSQCSQSAVNTKHFCFSQNLLQLDRKTDSYFCCFLFSVSTQVC